MTTRSLSLYIYIYRKTFEYGSKHALEGMKLHKSQLFCREQKGIRVLIHTNHNNLGIWLAVGTLFHDWYLAETEELPALKAKITSNARDVANKLFTGAWPNSFSILCGERIDSNHQLGLDDIVLIWNGMRNFETSPGWLWVQFSKRSRWFGSFSNLVLLTYIDTYFYITLWYHLVN